MRVPWSTLYSPIKAHEKLPIIAGASFAPLLDTNYSPDATAAVIRVMSATSPKRICNQRRTAWVYCAAAIVHALATSSAYVSRSAVCHTHACGQQIHNCSGAWTADPIVIVTRGHQHFGCGGVSIDSDDRFDTKGRPRSGVALHAYAHWKGAGGDRRPFGASMTRSAILLRALIPTRSQLDGMKARRSENSVNELNRKRSALIDDSRPALC